MKQMGGVGLLVFAIACANGNEAPATLTPGAVLPRLNALQAAEFNKGLKDFLDVATLATGLGPVYNEKSCAACHTGPGTAVGGTNDRMVTRFGRWENGQFDPLTAQGGTLLHDHAIGGPCAFAAPTVPPEANIVVHRRTPALFGLGLVDALPDETLRQLARDEHARDETTAGTVSTTFDIATGAAVVAKFGWKAQQSSITQFVGDAYVNEMGITNPLFPKETCPNGDCSLLGCNPAPAMNEDVEDLQDLTDFIDYLAPVQWLPQGDLEQHGAGVAKSIGCFDCHTQTLVAGDDDVVTIAHMTFHPYSDFLLHDMGSLGDGIPQGAAGPTQMRTQPLWGLRFAQHLLHDGRTTDVGEAILAHDGQGKKARDKFANLSPSDRDALLAFLKTL